jgi:hypothetical protein
MAKTLKYGEIFLYAKHGETYEIIDSTVIQAIGEKVTMKETPDGNIIMKKEGTHTSTDTDDIIKPYGAFTGATYKKVEEYEKVKLGHALDALNEGVREVFIKVNSRYVELDDRDSLYEDYNIYDLEDLMEAEFYILK